MVNQFKEDLSITIALNQCVKLLNQNKMKINFRKILIIILGLLWLWLTLTILYGCSANYHFGKFLKKGGTIDTTERVVTINKTIKVNGKDSIILVEMPVKCSEVQIPPTRTEIRYKYKLQRDSIKTVRYVTKWKTKEVVKTKRIETKSKSNWLFWFVTGVAAAMLVKFGFNTLLKRL